MSTDSKIFKLKYAQQPSNQFDGNKNGASWRLSTINYLRSRVQVVLEILHWAEQYGYTSVTKEAEAALGQHMDEDPAAINHLPWGFFSSNLVGAALEIFNNMDR